ncbi:MAG TPA: tetratricopeptide repeat protein [Bryobacteraceae bacterium]|nr:tetratricopeptide repeat protein [Bryobacteraceae bacterium]HPT28392.1 tetratricopeptide repeat protein [Bryobacteraceae bacterium]
MLGTIRRVVVLAGAVTLFAGLSLAQMGTFIGRVIGADGKPQKDVVIKIERTDIKGSWQTKTNKKGEWIYSGMQSGGRYTISCIVDGKAMDTVNGVRATMGEPVEIDLCNLQKVAAKNAAMQKAMETGQVTQEMARDMTPEQKAAMEKTIKERSESIKKNKALNDAFNAGMTAMQAKDYPAAIDALNKAGELDPKQNAVWANLASAHEGLGGTQTGEAQTASYQKATDAYIKAIELKPDDAGLHNNYGLLLAKMKNMDGAAAELDKAATLNPTGAGQYYFNLGAIMVNTGQTDAAVNAFKKCTEIDPKYANCWYYYGNSLSGKMQIQGEKVIPPDGMVAALEKYLEMDPTGANAEAAKGLLSTVSSSVQTKYVNPDAKKAPAKKKK